MLQLLKQILDKKSPLLIITIAILITIALALNQLNLLSCPKHTQIHYFQLTITIINASQIFLKTIGMQILKRCCGSHIYNLHIGMILILLLLNILCYLWSIQINYYIYTQVDCLKNEPHKFILLVYSITYTVVYAIIIGLFVGLKLQNKKMTLFQHQQAQNDRPHSDQY